MMSSKLALLLLAAAGSTGAFSSTAVPQLYSRQNVSAPRSLPVVESAKVLPFAYSGASAALLYRATKAVTKADQAVLIATATLSLFNLGPTDNARLKSAKRAEKIYPSCNPPSKHRKNALKWRSLVRIKLVGQLVGLVWMAAAKTSVDIMRGAATVMAANVAFFLSGAGEAMHDDDGMANPMPASKARGLLTIDAVLMIAALVAASSPADSARYARAAWIFAGGAMIGGLEGLVVLIAQLVNAEKK